MYRKENSDRSQTRDFKDFTLLPKLKPVSEKEIQSGDELSFGNSDSLDLLSNLAPSTPVLALVQGRIIDEKGNGIPGAFVTAQSHHSLSLYPRESKETRADQRGYYRLSELPLSAVQIIVRKKGYQLANEQLRFYRNESMHTTIRKDIILTSGERSLKGVVKNREGEPIANAQIVFRVSDKYLILVKETGADGRFRFRRLPECSGVLGVTAPGYAPWSDSGRRASGWELRIVLRRGATKIRGEVRYHLSNRIVPHCFVKYLDYAAPVKTNQNGRYETVSLSPGIYKLLPWKDFSIGFDYNKKVIRLVEDGPEQVQLNLVLPETVDIRGRVIDEQSGEPIPNAYVTAGSFERDKLRSPGSHIVQCDDQGRFRLCECTADYHGNVSIHVKAGGYPLMRGEIELVHPREIPPVTIKVKKGFHIHGGVYTPGGSFADGAEIRLRNITLDKTVTMEDDGEYNVFVNHYYAGREMKLMSYHPDYGYAFETLNLPSKAADIERDFHLQPGKELNVLVVNKKLKGVGDCDIEVIRLGSKGYRFRERRTTNQFGRTALKNFPPVPVKIKLSAKDDSREKTIDLSETQKGPVEVRFKINAPYYNPKITISGKITNNNGEPLKGKVAAIVSEERAASNKEGEYRLIIPHNMDSHLHFDSYGYQSKGVPFDPEKNEVNLNVVLEEARDEKEEAFFHGSVKTSDEKVPESATFRVVYTKGLKREPVFIWPRIRSVRENGHFRIYHKSWDDNVKKRYYIYARSPGYGAGYSQPVESKITGGAGPFRVTLVPGILKGRALNAETGKPVKNALICLGNPDHHDLRSAYRDFRFRRELLHWTTSGESGEFELSPVPPGKNEISVYHPDYWAQEFSAPEVSKNSPETSWNPKLSPVAEIAGYVKDHKGKAVSGARVVFQRRIPGSRKFIKRNDRSDEKGYYRIRGIPPGQYKLIYDFFDRDRNDLICHTGFHTELDVTEKSKMSMNLTVPELVPVNITAKKGGRFHSEDLPETSYYTILVLKKFDDGSTTAFLPPGKYRITDDDNQFIGNIYIDKEVEKGESIELRDKTDFHKRMLRRLF